MEFRDGLGPSELESTKAILFEYFQQTHAEAGMPVPVEVRELSEELRNECLNPAIVYRDPSLFVLAYLDDTLIGCAGLKWTGPHTVEWTRLFVRPGHRGNRGAELATHIIDRARRSGATSVVLSVLQNRIHAQKLFESMGFQRSPGPRSDDGFIRMYLSLHGPDPIADSTDLDTPIPTTLPDHRGTPSWTG